MKMGLEVAARRNDPNYLQIAGDVKKELTLGEGLEQAITLWLEHLDKSKDGAA